MINKIYYAHCKSIYETPQEKRDVELLEKFGAEVVNPGEKIHEVECIKLMESERIKNKMEYFLNLIETCDLVAFRSLPSGEIPVGVAKEISHAIEHGIPVIELPSLALRKRMTIEETRHYLAEIGER